MLDGVDHALMCCCPRRKSVAASPRHDIVVGILVLRIHLRRTRQLARLPARNLAVDEHVLDLCGDALRVVPSRVVALPRDVRHEARRAEDLVADKLEVRELRVVDADEDGARRREQPSQQLQPRVHHAQPLVVSAEVFALLADDLPEPLPDARVVYVVVVDPSLVAGVVRRIDVDAVNLALVLRQQRLERLEVVAVDDHVPAVRPAAVQHALLGNALKHAIGHVTMVVDHLVLAHPVQSRHVSSAYHPKARRSLHAKP